MRWWFGPGMTKSEIGRELEQMKAAGIGGVEIATLYPLGLDDTQTGFHNLTFLSNEHIEHLRFAASEARNRGLRVDITLGSGWPFGGRHIPITQAAGRMRVEQSPNQLCHPHRTIEQLLEKIILSFFQAVLADLAKPFGVVLLLQDRLLGNDRPRHVIDFPHYPTLRITQDWGITTIE